MIEVVSVDNMRKSDRYTIEERVPSLELMHRAGIYDVTIERKETSSSITAKRLKTTLNMVLIFLRDLLTIVPI